MTAQQETAAAVPLGGFVIVRSGAEVTLRCTDCERLVDRRSVFGLLDLVARACRHELDCASRPAAVPE